MQTAVKLFTFNSRIEVVPIVSFTHVLGITNNY